MSTNLEISREGRVLRLTLNRPEKRNALSFALCRELLEALTRAEQDAGIGAVLLAANGPVFCAGMDLDEVLEPAANEQVAIHEDLFTIGARLMIPVVAAVQGAALGGGLSVVANAHVAIAAQGATFGLSEIRLGLWPYVVFRSVALALSERRAVELSLTGRIFGVTEAREYGLVHQAVPPFELEDRAAAVAAALAASSSQAIRRGLAFVHQTRGLGWTEAGACAARFREEAFHSADFIEGVRAFREKRKPSWPSLSASTPSPRSG